MSRTTPWLITLVGVAVLAAACGGGSVDTQRPAPVISEITPSSGGAGGGTPVVITGTGLANGWQGGANQVLIGGIAADDVVVDSDSRMTCKTPAHTEGAYDVTVVKEAGAGTATAAFQYYPAPTLASVTPNAGSRDGGLTVTLTGTGFQMGDPGDPTVLFGSTPSQFVMVMDDTTIEAITPVSYVEKPVNLTVQNNYGSATLLGGYTYKGPVPVVNGVAPDSGSTNGGQAVTITGDFFTTAGGALTVKFGTAPGVNVMRTDDQTLTCITPISNVNGLVDVSVSNENGTGTLPNAYTFIAPPPSIASVTPPSTPENTSTNITIQGQGFMNFGAGACTVTLGGQPVTNVVVVSDTQITGTTPSLTGGFYDLQVSNNRGVATLTDAFEFQWVPQWITSLGSNQYQSDDSAVLTTFGFNFPFYGTNYSYAYTISNGCIIMENGSTYTSAYSGAFSSWPQISPCAWDLNPGSSGGVYFNTIGSDMAVITFSNVPWYPSSGSIDAQVQLRSDGKFALLYRTVTWYNSMVVGISPNGSPSGGSATVSFSNAPVIAPYQRASGTYTSSNWDLGGYAVLFKPDGAGGYTTAVYALP